MTRTEAKAKLKENACISIEDLLDVVSYTTIFNNVISRYEAGRKIGILSFDKPLTK